MEFSFEVLQILFSWLKNHLVAPPNSPKAAVKPLVDLTETSPNIDGDLEKVSLIWMLKIEDD